MDPLSILGALSASHALLKVIAGVIKDLADLHDKVQQADRAVQLLIDELSSLNVALTQIQSWAERVRSAGHASDGVVRGVNETLKGCKAVIDDFSKDIERLVKDISLPSGEIRANRVKYVWKEADIKEHQARLQSQKISLILSLFAAQCELSFTGPTRPSKLQNGAKENEKVENSDTSTPRQVMGDVRLSRIYFKGRPMSAEREIKNAPQLRFGIYYLPGTEVMDVERAEKNNLSGKDPDQLTALWRINTAGSLLNEVFINPDLSFQLKDRTRDILANTSFNFPEGHPPRNFKLLPCCAQRKDRSQSLAIAFTCTIDSGNIKLLNPLQVTECDFQSTLIEVHAGTLFGILIGLRQSLCSKSTLATSSRQVREFLQVVMSDVRNLYRRSPALLRMSTRSRIVQAKEIHYGVNLHSMFQTITTSAGILEIFKIFASYYNSLRGESDFDSIRTQGLQTFVLLLGLLTEAHLKELEEFVEMTLRLKIDRYNLEMLILKILPLMALDSEVFMKGLESAFDGLIESEVLGQDYEMYWKIFIRHALVKGYILSFTTSNVGRKGSSWITNYPQNGLKCSKIFSNLQYAGSSHRTYNDIPPIQLEDKPFERRVLVTLANRGKYWVNSSDLENIMCWNSGTYTLQEDGLEGNERNLTIQERNLTTVLQTAADHLESLRVKYNVRVALVRREQTSVSQHYFPDIEKLEGPGTIQLKEATLVTDLIAITHEWNGQRITRRDVNRVINKELRTLEQAVQFAEQVVKDSTLGITESHLRQQLDRAIESLADAKAPKPTHSCLDESANLPDDIVQETIYPDNDFKLEHSIWFEYEAKFEANDLRLHFVGWHDIVRRVLILGDGLFDVLLASGLCLNTLSLKTTEDESWKDEIRIDDSIILIGRYLAIVKKQIVQQNGSCEPPICSMINCMKIVKADPCWGSGQTRQSRYRAEAKAKAHSIFH